mmetsp:Transcript_87003/g.153857  ORF Transcript_87003/g.153857 Transcript_87003/m.153857 type:complete len:151 (+) Transcript_87003:2278-2730(+)
MVNFCSCPQAPVGSAMVACVGFADMPRSCGRSNGHRSGRTCWGQEQKRESARPAVHSLLSDGCDPVYEVEVFAPWSPTCTFVAGLKFDDLYFCPASWAKNPWVQQHETSRSSLVWEKQKLGEVSGRSRLLWSPAPARHHFRASLAKARWT